MTIDMTYRRLNVRPLASVIGAEIGGIDLSEALDQQTAAELETLLLEWKVLFFRNQRITYDQQIAFARNFGEVTPAHPIQRGHADKPEIFVVESRAAKKQFEHGTERAPFDPPRRTGPDWHTDITFVANPALASILRGAVIPSYGGDTLWTNLVAAYEDLSKPIRRLVDNLQAVHRWHGYNGETRAGYDTTQPLPSAVHPVVRVHPVTGEHVLFVNPVFTRYIVGLSERESRQILDLLFGQLARPEFTVRFKWETDSVAFWDNRATAHLGPVDLSLRDLDRRVERVTITGDVPVGPDGFTSQQLTGEYFT
ncbi:MAG: TauD/TfdA dioxygenase family protein [Acidimicrobiia bacterium]